MVHVPHSPRIAGAVVLYRPEADLLENVASYLPAVEKLYAVDNSEEQDPELLEALCLEPKVEYLDNGGNRGIAAALNRAAEKAIAEGYELLLTMDQDSVASPGMVRDLIEAAGVFSLSRIGIISPYHEMTGHRPPPSGAAISRPRAVPASGNLLNLAAYRAAGPFDEKLFIDFVDIEYCLRLRTCGFEIVQANDAVLFHRLGRAVRRWMFVPTHHPPVRKYYKTRNRFHVTNIYRKAFPGFCLSDRLRFLKEILCVLFFESEKREKLRMMARGYRDYRAGRFGPFAECESKLKVAFFTQATDLGAASRYRVYQYIPHLRSEGTVCRVLPAVPRWMHSRFFFTKSRVVKALGVVYILLKRFAQLPYVLMSDIVFFQKPVVPSFFPVFESVVCALRRKIVFDFDDAVYQRSPKWGDRESGAVDDHFIRLMQLSDAVIAGNEHLARSAAEYSAAVAVLPTVVDTSYYRADGRDGTLRGKVPVIGWIGSPTTAFYIEKLKPVFSALARSNPFILRIIGARTTVIPGVNVEWEEWSLARECELLSTVDIGIAPLDDSEWAKGKCGLKILLYMASGIPVVAGNAGVNAEIVRNGENGFLAQDDEDWALALKLLIEDAQLRGRFAAEGRRTAEEGYSLAAAAPELAAFLKGIANK
ncbi:MAG TPA: glycosyltransferase [bacterium]|nr:glycosyltransferase [bacterium]